MIDKFFETSRPGTPGTPPIVPGGASEHQFSPPSFSGINPMQGQPLQNFLERGFSSFVGWMEPVNVNILVRVQPPGITDHFEKVLHYNPSYQKHNME